MQAHPNGGKDAVVEPAPPQTGVPAAKSKPKENGIPDLVKVACHWAAVRGRPAAIFLLAEQNLAEDRPDVPITKTTVIQLANALGDDRFDDLDLVIQSSGGDIHAAYQMMSLLRGRMSGQGELVACVPGKAQSAATLLCLGADRILLGELGALGPLDAQIRIGVTDVGTPDYTSASHLIKGLDCLRRFSLQTFEETAISLYDHNVSRTEDILRYSIEFSRAITAPLYERVGSQNIGSWDQMLRTGEAYGMRLMERGKLIIDDANLNRAEHIAKVLRRLVYNYPSHETVIDREELAGDLHADLAEPRLRPVTREFATCNSETLIALVYPPGTKAPVMAAKEMSIADWKSLATGDGAWEVSWPDGEGRFLIRVGLYRQKILARNPWRQSARRVDKEGPTTQYATGQSRMPRSWDEGEPGATSAWEEGEQLGRQDRQAVREHECHPGCGPADLGHGHHRLGRCRARRRGGCHDRPRGGSRLPCPPAPAGCDPRCRA